MLGANLGLSLYGEVSVMRQVYIGIACVSFEKFRCSYVLLPLLVPVFKYTWEFGIPDNFEGSVVL